HQHQRVRHGPGAVDLLREPVLQPVLGPEGRAEPVAREHAGVDRPIAAGPRQLRHPAGGGPRAVRVLGPGDGGRLPAANRADAGGSYCPRARALSEESDLMNLERTPSTVVSYPRWLRGWSALTVGVSFAAIIVGTLVTTFGVGMADTVWPTPPWYLLFHQRAADFGYYVEHTHRIVAFLAALFVFIQSLGFWQQCADRPRRLLAQGSLIAMAIGLGEWMRLVRTQERAVAALANYGLVILAMGVMILLAVTIAEARSRAVGRWARAFVTVAAVGVISQAMLGGLRVYLNERAGQELRVVHGVVAQLVFASVCLLAMMAGRAWNSLVDLVTEDTLRKLS